MVDANSSDRHSQRLYFPAHLVVQTCVLIAKSYDTRSELNGHQLPGTHHQPPTYSRLLTE